MKEALRQARRGLSRTSPNPLVGAVIVSDGKIIAKGYHHGAGMPHAEIEALQQLGGKAENATLYVNLEPCNHHGRTPPCTEVILKSGIKRVVVGMKDPNPDVPGNGCSYLANKGIDVTIGVLETECRKLNEAFVKFITRKRPFVVIKSAMTMDGWTATTKGHSKWITNEKSRHFVHRLRDRADAVMVGIGTVIADNPKLTTRLKRGKGRDPLRIVLDTNLRMPHDAEIIQQKSSAMTMIVVGSHVTKKNLDGFLMDGVFAQVCDTMEGMIDLEDLLDKLGEMDINYLLVEGGSTVCGSLIRRRLADKFYLFKAPKLLGGDNGIPMAAGNGPESMDDVVLLKDIEIKRFGDDILVIGYPDYFS